MRLSIIIPVFQVEDFLDECLESIVKEKEQEMEILLIEDASPDNCRMMCDRWSSKDPRIHVIHHQRNMGLSEARNTGIEMAKGDYLAFVDSDDFIEPFTFQRLLSHLDENKEIDILEFPITQKYGDRKREHLLDFPDRVYPDTHTYWFETRAYLHTYACNKIFRRSLFEHVRFPGGKKFEDVYTLPQLLRRHPIVATTHQGHYYYRWNPNGITATADGSALDDLLSAHLRILNELRQSSLVLPGKGMGDYYHQILNIQLDVCEQLGIPPRLPILPYHQTLKLKLLHLLGINKLCKLNQLLHKIRLSR